MPLPAGSVSLLGLRRPSTNRADAELTHARIRLARAGERAAFAELYAANVVAIRHYARKLVRSDQAADDLVAEAFLRTWLQLLEGRGPDQHFRAYVRTTVLNIHRTQLQENERMKLVADIEVAAVLDPLLAARLVEPSPEDAAIGSVLYARLNEALTMLPQHWRTVLVLVYLEDVPYTEVSGRLGLSVDATRHLTMRARAGFRKALTTLQERDGEQVDSLSALVALSQLRGYRVGGR